MTNDQMVVLDGSTFFVSEPSGDIGTREAQGFFHADVRHLSVWSLRINERPVKVLTNRNLEYYSGRIFATLATARVGENPTISVQRDRIVAGGVHEDIYVDNHSEVQQRLQIEIQIGADFADIFEIKQRSAKRGRSWAETGKDRLTLWHEREGYRRGTRITFSAKVHVQKDRAVFEIILAPRARWQTCVDMVCIVKEEERHPLVGHGGIGKLEPQMPLSLHEWMSRAPVLETPSDALRHTYRQSLLDLAALRLRLVAPRSRPALVHGGIRTRQLDHGVPGAALPRRASARHTRIAGDAASYAVRRLSRCRAGKDSARDPPR